MHTHKKQEAIKLRFQGKSYNEICRALQLPSKGTLSVWFKDLILPSAAKKRLAKKMQMAHERGLLAHNRRRSTLVQKENKVIRADAIKEIRQLSYRELLLVGAALYWGEGYKNGKAKGLSLANTDPALILLYMRFVREVLKVPDERIRMHVHLHPYCDQHASIQFWSHLTRLPKENFHTTWQVSRASRGRRPKRTVPYGTLDVRVHRRQLFYRVLGLIDGLAKFASH